MPTPTKLDTRESFIKKYMSSSEAINSFPDNAQRYAVALSVWKERNKKKNK